jgi:hypothetical protein
VTLDEVLQVLESGIFEPLIGVAETGQIDFKGVPYDLTTDHGKMELAKDVIAFANGYGPALIVLGARTAQRPESPFDTVEDVSPIPRERIDEGQYRQVLQSRCYPAIRGVTVTAYRSEQDPGRVLVGIAIPSQNDDDRPFLVLSPLSAEGERVQGWLLGVPTRSLDQTEHIRESELHAWIRGGRSVTSRLDEIILLLGREADTGPQPPGARVAPDLEDEGTPPVAGAALQQLRDRPRRAALAFASEDEGGYEVVMPALCGRDSPEAPLIASASRGARRESSTRLPGSWLCSCGRPYFGVGRGYRAIELKEPPDSARRAGGRRAWMAEESG